MVYTFSSSSHILYVITVTPKLWPKHLAYETVHFSFTCLCSTNRSHTLMRPRFYCCLSTSFSKNACCNTKTWHRTEIISHRMPGWWVILACLKKGAFWIIYLFIYFWKRKFWVMLCTRSTNGRRQMTFNPRLQQEDRLRAVFNPLCTEAHRSTKEFMKESVSCWDSFCLVERWNKRKSDICG